ncbi:hypothetical protein HXX76_002303 [Chlamydomonas incerta]|uniref:Magnesium transporter n=1 Tax=Chlamydomonas incerta TaxID=51695 RepID=A0A836B0T5_CHLIN|nr:hypothetical protein HXX76_002303 [Chlamydomonas incerta]|eukprot:KAG2443964.1 hypothetical protein HXX76_002303 [Chlamydomonas incerta]
MSVERKLRREYRGRVEVQVVDYCLTAARPRLVRWSNYSDGATGMRALREFLDMPRPVLSLLEPQIRWVKAEGFAWDLVKALAGRYNLPPLLVSDLLGVENTEVLENFGSSGGGGAGGGGGGGGAGGGWSDQAGAGGGGGGGGWEGHWTGGRSHAAPHGLHTARTSGGSLRRTSLPPGSLNRPSNTAPHLGRSSRPGAGSADVLGRTSINGGGGGGGGGGTGAGGGGGGWWGWGTGQHGPDALPVPDPHRRIKTEYYGSDGILYISMPMIGLRTRLLLRSAAEQQQAAAAAAAAEREPAPAAGAAAAVGGGGSGGRRGSISNPITRALEATISAAMRPGGGGGGGFSGVPLVEEGGEAGHEDQSHPWVTPADRIPSVAVVMDKSPSAPSQPPDRTSAGRAPALAPDSGAAGLGFGGPGGGGGYPHQHQHHHSHPHQHDPHNHSSRLQGGQRRAGDLGRASGGSASLAEGGAGGGLGGSEQPRGVDAHLSWWQRRPGARINAYLHSEYRYEKRWVEEPLVLLLLSDKSGHGGTSGTGAPQGGAFGGGARGVTLISMFHYSGRSVTYRVWRQITSGATGSTAAAAAAVAAAAAAATATAASSMSRSNSVSLSHSGAHLAGDTLRAAAGALAGGGGGATGAGTPRATASMHRLGSVGRAGAPALQRTGSGTGGASHSLISEVRRSDAGYLLYLIMRGAVDQAYDVVRDFSAQLSDFERRVRSGNLSATATEQLHVMSTDLQLLDRRFKATSTMLRLLTTKDAKDDSGTLTDISLQLSANAQAKLKALAEQVRGINAEVDSLAQQAAQLTDLVFNLIAHRSNSSMRVLSVISTVFLPVTFLAGVYGTNFDNLPELHWELGYMYFWILVTCVGVVVGTITMRAVH